MKQAMRGWTRASNSSALHDFRKDGMRFIVTKPAARGLLKRFMLFHPETGWLYEDRLRSLVALYVTRRLEGGK